MPTRVIDGWGSTGKDRPSLVPQGNASMVAGTGTEPGQSWANVPSDGTIPGAESGYANDVSQLETEDLGNLKEVQAALKRAQGDLVQATPLENHETKPAANRTASGLSAWWLLLASMGGLSLWSVFRRERGAPTQ